MRNESILKDWPEKVRTTYLFLKALLKVVSSDPTKNKLENEMQE